MGRIRLLFIVSILALMVSCSGGGEQQILKTFFIAVQGKDSATLSGVSVVKFPGKVTSWEILEVGPESKDPFTLAAKRAKFLDLEKSVEKKTEENDAFIQENAKKAEEYQKRIATDPDYEFKGDMADFQTEWKTRVDDQKQLQANLEEARHEVDELRDAAALSLNTLVNDNFKGDVVGTTVRVKVNDGTEDKIYWFTIQRFNLSDAERNLTPMSRWIITGIKEQDA
jgi:hypothetical protein